MPQRVAIAHFLSFSFVRLIATFAPDYVVPVYRKYLNHEEVKLSFHTLILFSFVTVPRQHIKEYQKCQSDKNHRIGALALNQLS